MTIEEKRQRRNELETKRNALVDQLASIDTTSGSLSSGGGSKSYTNRSVDDIKAKIAFLDDEIARLNAEISGRPSPSSATILEPVYS